MLLKKCLNSRGKKGEKAVASLYKIISLLLIIGLFFLSADPVLTEKRLNHSGRDLGEMPPPPKEPVWFNTPEADKVMAAVQVFPINSPYNEDISGLKALPDSDKMIAANSEKEKVLGCNLDMGYIIVPPDFSKVDLNLDSRSQSDPGPYPLPDNAPIENWPFYDGYSGGEVQGLLKWEKIGRTFEQVQAEGNGDRHVLVIDPWNLMLYEFYCGHRINGKWTVSNEATFDLKTNKARKNGWTSSDAAGLPVMPLTVRYDDVARGIVEHCVRVTVQHTIYGYVWPATHLASSKSNKLYPRMGERLRLKKEIDITKYTPHAQAILAGLKKYGMMVADNGFSWLISITPDDRIKGLEDIYKIKNTDLEFIETTGKNGGPRTKRQ